MEYQKIKEWFKEKENQQKVVLCICFVLVFLVGFGTGSYARDSRPKTFKQQPNYTTSTDKKPVVLGADQPAPQAGTVVASSTSASCIVKGNISSAGKKIYHVQGGAFYARVKPEQCFNTTAQAEAAGFVKSSR